MTKLYKTREIAEILGVSPSTVREWLATGHLKGIKVGQGKYWRVTQEQLDTYLEERHG